MRPQTVRLLGLAGMSALLVGGGALLTALPGAGQGLCTPLPTPQSKGRPVFEGRELKGFDSTQAWGTQRPWILSAR